jgi:NAD(P)-dependent dehydrogenase (short-subunit alcohol dehydrogenase family)
MKAPQYGCTSGRCELLAGKVAVVTGAASGLGYAIAKEFARAGATVVGCDVRGTCEAMRSIAEFREADVSSETAVARLVDDVFERHAALDVFVNNAAVQIEAELTETSEADVDRTLSVNLKGVFFGTKHAVRVMRDAGGGSVVNVSSVLGLVGDGMLPAYCASKGGVLGLTRSAAVQYARDGIRCNALCPGDIDTPLLQTYLARLPDPLGARADIERHYPTRRIAQPEEVAQVALFLASDLSELITGQALVADGGLLASCY